MDYIVQAFKPVCAKKVIVKYAFKHYQKIECARDKRVTEIDYHLYHAIFSTACSIVYKYCTIPISKHLYSGIIKDPFNRKCKIFKNRQYSLTLWFMFKIGVFLLKL